MALWIMLAVAALASPPAATSADQPASASGDIAGALIVPTEPALKLNLPGYQPEGSRPENLFLPAGYFRSEARRAEREAHLEALAESEATLSPVGIMNLRRPRCDFHDHGQIMACGDTDEQREEAYERVRPLVENAAAP